MSARRLVSMIVVLLCAVVCGLALASVPALALKTHIMSGSIGGPGKGNGQFEDPAAVAVNDSTVLTQPGAGDVYVADTGGERIERFSSTGAFLGQFNGSGAFEVEGAPETGPATPAGHISVTVDGLAVDSSGDLGDPSAGDVYVLDRANKAIDKFSATGEYEGQLTGFCQSSGTCPGAVIPFDNPVSVAVDSAGDLWVGEYETATGLSEGNFISEISDTGSFINRIHLFTNQKGGAGFGRLEPGLTIDPSGNLYMDSAQGPIKVNQTTGEVEYDWRYVNGLYQPYSKYGNPIDSFPGLEHPAFDPSTDSVLFVEPVIFSGSIGAIAEFSLSGELSSVPVSTFGAGGTSAGESWQGLAVSSGGTVYTIEPATSRVVVFDEVVLPNVTTGSASHVSETGATMNATVNPSGVPVTGCEFEYVSGTVFRESFANEVQTLTFSPASRGNNVNFSYGGDFAVTFESETTAPIPYNASAVEVQSALELLGSVGGGNVEVTGNDGGPYTVEFRGSLAHTNVSQLTVETSGLTPSESVVATVKTLTEGGDGGFHAVTSVPCAESPSGSVEVPVSADINGLLPGTEYDFRLRVENAQGPNTGEISSFTTFTPLVVGGDSFSGVGAGSVTLNAEIDPGGRAVDYHFEYGTSEAYGSLTPEVEVEHGYSTIHVHQQVSGLTPSTQYHFRVVAVEHEGAVQEGADVAFSTFPVVVSGLPDGRVYEMVTPVENNEANVNLLEAWPALEVPSQSSGLYRAAADGDTVEYESAPTVGGTGNNANTQLAIRSSTGGWTQQNIQPQGVPFGDFFASLSSELEDGIVASGVPLVAGGFSGGNGEFGYYVWRSGVAGYQVLPGEFVGESADGMRQLVEESERLYEVSDSEVIPVGVLPNGDIAGASNVAGANGVGGLWASGAVSADGSRVVWTAEEGGQRQLYLRDMTSGETVQLDAAQGGPGSGAGKFWTASEDGSRAFFTDEQQLTSDSTAAGGAPDLYECVMVRVAGKLACELHDLTIDHNGSANVRGVLGTSENGEYVYFAAAGELASGASQQECNRFSADWCNLYVSHDGNVKFVAKLSSQYDEDSTDWAKGLSERTAEVSANGSLVFISNQDLTGYDTTGDACIEPEPQRTEPGGCKEVYVYDPGNDGSLVCASCRTGGEPPTGTIAAENYLPTAIQSNGNTQTATSTGTYQMRWISDDGDRVFFDSGERLVARDTNGRQDVYEWERDGTGSCETSPGCVYLLSSGSGTSSSYLLDASASGDDVFIISRDPLVQAGQPADYSVYDARVGGVIPVSPPACTGTGCQGVPEAPPTFATPSSVTFNGVGNFSPPTETKRVAKPKTKAKSTKCRKGYVRKKDKCVKKAKAKRSKAKRTVKSAKGRK